MVEHFPKIIASEDKATTYDFEPRHSPVAGVSVVWTGMHKDGGRQIWDEAGKGMVVAYRG